MSTNYLQFLKTTLNTVKYKLVPAGNYESLHVCQPQRPICLQVDEIENAAHCILLHEFKRLQGDSVPSPALGLLIYPRLCCSMGKNDTEVHGWSYPSSVILMKNSNSSLRHARIEILWFINTIYSRVGIDRRDTTCSIFLTLEFTMLPYDEL